MRQENNSPYQTTEIEDIAKWAAIQWENSDISLSRLSDWTGSVDVLERSNVHLGSPVPDRHPVAKPTLDMMGWDGPNDPANPMNWSNWKKAGIISTIAFLTLITSVFQENDSNL
jgi:hypothetical protein